MECIKDMINRLCPNGVKRIKLADCLEYEQPTKYQVSSKDYLDNGTPVLTAGQTFILGYTDETNGVYHASKEQPVIIFDDFTTSFHWVDFDFKVKSSAMKMLTPCNEEANFRFIYYAMKCIKYETLEHSRQWISTYSQFEIPLPPMEIQNRIVEVLDKMTTLTAELEAELEARKQQYEYYRSKLLTFNEIGGGIRQVTWMKINEIGTIYRGIAYSKKDFTETGTPCIHYGQIYTRYGTFANKTFTYVSEELANGKRLAKKGDLVMAVTSENMEDVGKCLAWLGEDDILVSNHACFIRHSLNPKYLAYFLQTSYFFNYKKKISKGVKVIDLDLNMFGDMLIPVPSMEEQERIVSILDRFEALTTDLQIGLPAEIEARRQQYEYYRNKLLTFDQAA